MHFLCKWGGWLLLPLGHQAAAQVNVTVQPVAPAPYRGSQAGQDYQRAQGGYMIPPGGGAAGPELSRYLNALASNPDDVAALTGAGRAALELEDAEAALTFFGRAEELAPNDARIKAGLGSALALMEQPESALQFFYQAAQMGVPAADMAAWRGLAYDSTGDTWRAQQDYQLALRVRENPETRRRLALSLAISGQRDAALATIDSQLRRQERAAWRVRAFILALTGDARGATQVVELVMPDQAAAMAPFLARLPSLSAADRARAVHFGHFPGSSYASSASASAAGVGGPPPRTEPVTSAGRPDPGQTALGSLVAVQAAPAAPPAATSPPVVPAAPVSRAPILPPPVAVVSPPASLPVTVAPPPASLAPGFSVQAPAAGAAATALAGATPPPEAGPIRPPPPSRNLADLATVIARLKDPPPAAKLASKPAPAKPAPARPAPPREPSRKWVQLSIGRNDSALAGEYRRIRARAPKLFASTAVWTAEEGDSNRLLVGPFKSNKEAQDFVNQLRKEDVRSFSWTSESGQEIKKLPSK